MRQNAEEEVERLYQEHYNALLIYARTLLKRGGIEEETVAEEVVQEAFVVTIENVDDVMNAPNELGWLRSVVRNVIRNMRRRRKVELQIVLSLDALKVDPGYIDKREQNFETLEACRALLTPEEFKVVKGVVVDKMPYVQVAQQMNISLWNCYKIKARAMAKLKKDLESVKKSIVHVQKEPSGYISNSEGGNRSV